MQRSKVLDEQRRTGPRRVRLRSLMLALGVTCGLCGWGLQRRVVVAAAPFLAEIAAAPHAACILVPGAKVHEDGEPCSMLVDRLAAAAQLYGEGAAPLVVVSGRGGGSMGEDEVGAMRRWLTARGVPADRIAADPDGLRTIDSVRNCREVLGMRSALMVSNDFHVPRMVFLGRRLGLESYGVAAPALVRYSPAVRWKNIGRELLARARAVLEVDL